MRPSRRILIVTSGPLCRNPRPWKEAITLSGAGFEVTVLSVFATEECVAQDAELLAASRVRQIWLRPCGPALARHWRRVRVGLARYAVAHLRWQCPLVLGPTQALLARIRALPADLTIVHNEAPLWAGRQLLKEGRRVAADFEDWHSEDLLAVNRQGRPLPLLRSLERDLLHRAVYVSTTSHALADALHRTYAGQAPRVVINAFPRQTLPGPVGLNATPSFFWFSQTIGPGRGLEPFLEAWAIMRKPSRLVLLGKPRVAYRERLISLLPEARRAEVEFHEPVSPLALPTVIARHDIGLALEPADSPSRNLTITNKFFQYLNAGLAVLASDTAGQREVFAAAPEIGEIVSLAHPTPLATRLDALLGDPIRLSGMKGAARRAVEARFGWDKTAPLLLRFVEEACAASWPPAQT
jgi:glycosyltransferase involved in cell wall biosynthesis